MVKSPVKALPSGAAVPNISENVKQKHQNGTVPLNQKGNEGSGVNKLIPNITVEEILDKAGGDNLEEVEAINLHACGITKIVHIEKFVNLRALDLSCNAITQIENLFNGGLKDLKLYGNLITTVSGLKHLVGLESISLQHNRIRSIDNGFATQRDVKTIRLDSNQITQIDAKDFNSCRSLESLDMSYNLLESLSPLKFASNLVDLSACGNRLRKIDCNSNVLLVELDLSFNSISDVSGVSALVNLHVLRLTNNNITSLQPMGELKKLAELHIGSNLLTHLHYLRKQFPHLDYLDISSNKISDWKNIEYLKHCQSVKELYIVGNPCVTEQHLSAISAILPNIRIVDGQYREEKAEKNAILHKRAASATTGITVRQVQNELSSISMNLTESESNIMRTFDSIRELMSSLPLHPHRDSPTPRETTSRCSSRARLHDAILFASINSEDPS